MNKCLLLSLGFFFVAAPAMAQLPCEVDLYAHDGPYYNIAATIMPADGQGGQLIGSTSYDPIMIFDDPEHRAQVRELIIEQVRTECFHRYSEFGCRRVTIVGSQFAFGLFPQSVRVNCLRPVPAAL